MCPRHPWELCGLPVRLFKAGCDDFLGDSVGKEAMGLDAAKDNGKLHPALERNPHFPCLGKP